MTQFNKADFSYHGGYLMYDGAHTTAEFYQAGTNVHPSRVGTQKSLFIARFKYNGPVTKAKFLAELIKNHTVEGYVDAMKSDAPTRILAIANPQWFATIMKKVTA
jgi:hypothetical protein